MNRLKNLSVTSTVTLAAAVAVSIYTARLLLRSRKRRKITRIIDTIESFQRPGIRMKNPDEVEDKVCQLIKGGKDKLQVISDFDMTLSRYSYNGRKGCITCHAVLESSPRMPALYRERVKALKEKYYPLEIDINLTAEQKTPLMVEWWSKAHRSLLECDIYKSEIPRLVKESGLLLRDSCDSFLAMLYKHNVPLLIFSGGIGDILEEAIRLNANMYDNIKVIANYMDFSEKGKMQGFRGEIIHAFNKNSYALSRSKEFGEIEHRTNVILLGDSLGDVGMGAGLPKIDNILRIGYLNHHEDQNLATYMDNFDIVIMNDETLDLVNSVLQKVL